MASRMTTFVFALIVTNGITLTVFGQEDDLSQVVAESKAGFQPITGAALAAARSQVTAGLEALTAHLETLPEEEE